MDVKFSCTVCRKLLVLDDGCIGRKVQCPFCGNVFAFQSPRIQQIEPDRSEQNPPPKQEPDGTKSCPMCGEKILSSAKKCRYCGEYLIEDQQHTIVNGPNGERLFSRSTYVGEQPIQMPKDNHETLCFWLGFLFGISILGILVAYLIGGKEGLVASLKGVLVSILVWFVACIFIGGCASAF